MRYGTSPTVLSATSAACATTARCLGVGKNLTAATPRGGVSPRSVRLILFQFFIMSKARSLIVDWGNPYTFKQRLDGRRLALACSQVGAQGEVQGRPRRHPPVRIRSRGHDA